ncbi:calcium-independent phospholipase A2-gamma-like [Micropterus salmoides]|uniref:calcium-independent phospholipase A2-gamma-like n=1 Tax=Micropterus salmoides TaxID=27706 RepID=UPI0018ED858B|nr:calcium-independent phospholipase A2-gamma-like [Micropterus salmoides]
MGSHLLVETSRNPECPKVAAVSTIVNRGTPLKAYVFRNYNLLPGVRSHYLGGCQHQLWQAIRATSAAPGYFQEFTLGNDLHQTGMKI